MEQHTAEIESTIRDYIEGWYSADPDRMKRALHPDLAKRGFHLIEATGKAHFIHASSSSMVEYTRAGLGKLDPGADPEITVKILELCDNTASAVATSIKFIDHIHLATCDGRWPIVNVRWEPAPKS